ncbi:hypothetical protein NKJ90_21740 [Mesorhizobium sp. M0051]|uniref:hypothetical protein n=1 Tax=unclassified Mesorhizobium TaxID=325217 RepID=UPI0003CE1E03|nr:hypothetical protein [Mesorhizobium sp. LNHC252B00]ESY74460.1 hypothetical protein X743_08310 [Mesorhizobium sp. LNHC252B00]
MFLASLDRWHPIRLCFYGFLAATGLGALYCMAPCGVDPHLRIFKGLLAMYAAFLCAIAIFIQSLRKQDGAIYSQLISRFLRIRGFDGQKALSYERSWFATTVCFVGLSLAIPLYALSKTLLSWSELGWRDVVGSTSGMLVGLFFLCDFHFLLQRRLANS